MVHERPDGTAKRNFNDNKFNSDGTERFIEGIDFFKVNKKDVGTNFVLTFGFEEKAPSGILITESGYLMLVKSLTDDLAWQVQRELVNNYFRQKTNNSIKIIALIHEEVGQLIDETAKNSGRITNLENNMTIDYGQQLTLQEIAKSRAVKVIGGMEKPAYKNKSLRGSAFSQIWKDYKDYFRVNSYKNTLKVDYSKAKEYLERWTAQGKLLREIEDANNQLDFKEEAI